MSAAVLTSVTRPERKEVDVSNAPEQLRVAIREIREYAYRALVVSGASPGEAASAADQVLHAELHTGDGLAGLATGLASGPWSAGALMVRRTDTGVLDVDCSEVAGELRVSAAVTDLLAGEGAEAQVRVAGEVGVSSLWDGALLAAAAATGSDIAVQRREAGVTEIRLATPDGELLVGHHPPDGHGESGLVVRAGMLVRPDGRAISSRSSTDARVERRRTAAGEGVAVDATVWTAIAEQAGRFLVPE